MRTIFKACAAVLALSLVQFNGAASTSPLADSDDVIRVPAFDLPASSFLTPQARSAGREWQQLLEHTAGKVCPPSEEDMPQRRRCWSEKFYPPLIGKVRSRYAVTIASQTIAGVKTELITPAEGVPTQNRKRVLINLHGGAFTGGSPENGRLESIPIAALGKFKVVALDYRLAPEHQHPAGALDAVAVYRALLNEYQPGNIGIYGCSAGGLLTAQAVAWLQKEGLPRPGAVGMFCSGASYPPEGDSGYLSAAIDGKPRRSTITARENSYFEHVHLNDPLAFPVRSAKVLANFPPSLLIAATRDGALSSVVKTHSVLIAQGVEAELHVWEGVGHAFFVFIPDLPESREAHEVIVKFFDSRLGKPGKEREPR